RQVLNSLNLDSDHHLPSRFSMLVLLSEPPINQDHAQPKVRQFPPPRPFYTNVRELLDTTSHRLPSAHSPTQKSLAQSKARFQSHAVYSAPSISLRSYQLTLSRQSKHLNRA